MKIKTLTKEGFKALKEGDVVQNLGSGRAYVIIGFCNGLPVAVRMVQLSNSGEWAKIVQ